MIWVTLALALLFPFADTNWPQFRGPAAGGVGSGTPPLEWNADSGKNIRWKAEIPGLGHSSPVIWGDRIFLTTAVGAGDAALKVGLYGDIDPVKGEGEQSFRVYCLDRKSGKILWERIAVSEQPKILRHPKSTHANPTPATDGKHLVAFFGSEGLFTYDLSGKLLWKKDLGLLDSGFYMVPDAQWGFAASPVIYEDMVLIQADVQKNAFLAAFDINTGKELWRTTRDDVSTFSTPAVFPYTAGGAHGQQVVVNGWKHIGGYEFAHRQGIVEAEGRRRHPGSHARLSRRPDHRDERARTAAPHLRDPHRRRGRHHRKQVRHCLDGGPHRQLHADPAAGGRSRLFLLRHRSA